MRDTSFERFLEVIEDTTIDCGTCPLRDKCIFYLSPEPSENIESDSLPTCPEALFEYVMTGSFPLHKDKFTPS